VELDAPVGLDALVESDAVVEDETLSVQGLTDMLDAVASGSLSDSPYALQLRPVPFCLSGTTIPNRPVSQHQVLSKSMVFAVLQSDQSATGHCQKTFDIRDSFTQCLE
jgi:hypothetical protein